jgi:phytoene synthase
MSALEHVAPTWLDPAEGRAIIQHHSKSFSLASRLLGETAQARAVALYAYCRRADDAIDLAPSGHARQALQRLQRELADVYGGRALNEPVLSAFQRLVFEHEIPRAYPEALLAGFELDVAGECYQSLDELYRYCWCVAGSVGAMMCHVLGVRRERAVVHGAHLGMAMQLTNICRDVAEDWRRGRLYVPTELLAAHAVDVSGKTPPPWLRARLSGAVRRLLAESQPFYRSGDWGLRYLSFRSRLAVSSARQIYSGIGDQLLARGGNTLAGRVFVPRADKLRRTAMAALGAVATSTWAPSFRPARLSHILRFPDDVLPV